MLLSYWKDENKKTNNVSPVPACSRGKNAIIKLAPQTFSSMNVLFIIEIFVGVKSLEEGEKIFDDFSSKSAN